MSQVDKIERVSGAVPQIPAMDSLHAAEEHEVVEGAQFLVNGQVLRNITDALAVFRRVGALGDAADGDRSTHADALTGYSGQGGALARPVGPQKREDLPGRQFQSQSVNGDTVAVPDSQVADAQRAGRHAPYSMHNKSTVRSGETGRAGCQQVHSAGPGKSSGLGKVRSTTNEKD